MLSFKFNAGGLAGNLKMTMPTAFATTMLAWSLLSFRQGSSAAAVQQQVTWGADYLLKTVQSSNGAFYIAYQVLLYACCCNYALPARRLVERYLCGCRSGI